MKGLQNHIGNLAIGIVGRAALRRIPVPSPTTLLVALILGPALLMAMHSAQPAAAFADTADHHAITRDPAIHNAIGPPAGQPESQICDGELFGICLPF